MRKLIALALVSSALLGPAAQADGTPITVEFEYDSRLLATEAGALEVLQTIRQQANEACAFTKAVTRGSSFDRACRDDLLNKAIAEIRLAARENGQAATLVFAALTPDELTDAQ